MLRTLVVVIALIAAVVPYPAALIERMYSRGLYPRFQPILTQASNASPVAIIDGVVLLLLAWGLVSVVRRWRKRGFVPAVVRLFSWTLTTAAAVYLLFLATWGLNYRRLPLESK